MREHERYFRFFCGEREDRGLVGVRGSLLRTGLSIRILISRRLPSDVNLEPLKRSIDATKLVKSLIDQANADTLELTGECQAAL